MTFVISDSNQTSAVGFSLSGADEVVIIAPNVLVSSTDNFGVEATGANSTMINSGTILSGKTDGATVDSGIVGVSFVNQAWGLIEGKVSGVVFSGTAGTLTNFGEIAGAQDGVDLEDSSNTFVNFGTTFGGNTGVGLSGEGQTVQNQGTIQSDNDGIIIDNALSQSDTIVNSGTIGGLVHGIYIISGSYSLTNSGTINGGIFSEDFDSGRLTTLSLSLIPKCFIANSGVIHGRVVLDIGNDVFDGRGGLSGPIFGGGGNDRIIGGRGNDEIHGGPGNNTMAGGPGSDRFVFDSRLGAQLDTITDFSQGADKIVLSARDFPALGALGRLAAAHFHIGSPTNGHAEILYRPSNGALYYDSNGNHAGGLHHFATLTNHAALHIANFIIEA